MDSENRYLVDNFLLLSVFLSQTGHLSPQSLVLTEIQNQPLVNTAEWFLAPILVWYLLFHCDDPGVDGFLFSLHQLDIIQDLIHFLRTDFRIILTH